VSFCVFDMSHTYTEEPFSTSAFFSVSLVLPNEQNRRGFISKKTLMVLMVAEAVILAEIATGVFLAIRG